MPHPSTVPLPVRCEPDAAGLPLSLDAATVSGTDAAVADVQRVIGQRTGNPPARAATGSIRLSVSPGGTPESYRLRVADGVAEIVGADDAGLFYGIQTLAQLVERADDGWRIPAVAIDDAPRFAYRGAMLDVARHFHPVPTVTAYLDRIASLKLNHLHLHLTDDQGWRLALSSRPALTERAAASAVGGAPGGFYTREEFETILAHAASRHVTIVPEVDVPGHTHAVGLAYPELAADPVIGEEARATIAEFGGGDPVPGQPYTGLAVGFSSLRIGEPGTEEFLRDVFGELARRTPGPYVHLGGDECLGTDPDDFAAFVRLAVRIVRESGKTPIAWHEAALVPGVAAEVVSQFWGYVHAPTEDRGAAVLRDPDARVILSPADAVYLDMKPDADATLGLTWANGPTSVHDAYTWDPTDLVADERRILGVEAPMWSETVSTLADIDALAFPRLAAAAEIAWSPAAAREWDDFRTRVAGLAPLWRASGYGLVPSAGIAWREG